MTKNSDIFPNDYPTSDPRFLAFSEKVSQLDSRRVQLDLERYALVREAVSLIEQGAPLIPYLYWEYDTLLDPEEIAYGLGITTGELRKHVGKYRTCFMCAHCSAIAYALVASHSAAKRLRSRPHLCDPCEQKAQAVRTQRSEVHRRELQQRLQTQEAHARQLSKMPYNEYLKTDEWKAIRSAKVTQARHRCQLCSRTGRLHVHHRTYERRGHESMGDLIVLCQSCHAKFHNKIAEP